MPSSLVGRTAEIAVLAEAIARADAGHGGGLLLTGDPGVGKSALLDAAAEQARQRGARVLRCVGTPSESDRPYAGLRRLLTPVLGTIEAPLPATRQALRAALGDSDEPVTAHRVGLAALQLLTDAAQRAPLTVIADDVQWLDAASCHVLAFVVRRLADDPVLMVAAARAGDLGGNPLAESQLRVVPVNPLDEHAAAVLLDARAPGLPPLVREHLLNAAEGNPLALTELPLAIREERDILATPALPLTERLARSFGDRAAGLPVATRTLLLVMAVNDGDTVAEMLAAASRVTGTPTTLDELAPAERAGLIRTVSGRLVFRHPLVRAAVDRSAAPDLRRAVHAALADLAGDEERRVRHRAAATVGTDEEVAASLERLAVRAVRRGAGFTAEALLERSVTLSPDPHDAIRRALAAVSGHGYGRPATPLLRLAIERADPAAVDPMTRCVLEMLTRAETPDRFTGAPAALTHVARVVSRHGATDPAKALRLLESVGNLAFLADLDEPTRTALLAALDTLPLEPGDPRRTTLMAQISPWERGPAVLASLAGRRPGDATTEADLALGLAALFVGALPTATGFLRSGIDGLRSLGNFANLSWALAYQAWACALLARHPATIAAAGECTRLTGEGGTPRWAMGAALAEAAVSARRGQVAPAHALADRTEATLTDERATPLVALVQLVRGTAGLAAGDPQAALDALLRMFDPHGGAYNRNLRGWGFTDLMDAAALTGRLDAVRDLHAEMTELAARTGSPQLTAATAASAPLLAAAGTAEAAFDRALASGLHDWPWQRGSLLLHYGSWLRRQRRRTEARGPLRAAYEAYESIGAQAWAERAAEELRSAGENVSGLARPAMDTLTSQELQIAQLAAEGLTNREIGDRLYVSPRTVRNHLYNIFPKLGVSSRAELAEVVQATDGGNGIWVT
ncbi:helix-turn-helix transcriptional regulator [Catenuloplanes indicus]|uniref:DNA-binding CsgD family transcriptional regulator n=1 Tax=Catenuloplanes indicus TaxID=137267 RepID=A0AAE3VXD7_9ACTN|nr:LuxR family transcriptional regulator [Catenuloplanes indicus]MDQ0365047.1 DNA-binding CsgD family transcriptional regulator [Catenuloplanes indicus]